MMNAATKQINWSTFLKLFSEQNLLRPTRIGVFEGAPDALTDYSLEDGLPLTGIDIDTHCENAPSVQIMLGDATNGGSGHLTHIVSKVRRAGIFLSIDGESDGLDLEDADGKTTILRFENSI